MHPIHDRELTDLTDDEAALLYTVQMWGLDAWPVHKLGSGWSVGPWRSWKGFPSVYKTRREARETFERWMSVALDRWSAMTRRYPGVMTTAYGVKYP